jgi:hypothetical protein
MEGKVGFKDLDWWLKVSVIVTYLWLGLLALGFVLGILWVGG